MEHSAGTYLVLIAASLAAGIVNALAGGGTLLTFPALTIGAGMPGVLANGTSTVALMPGSLASVWGYRRELHASRDWIRLLLLPSLLGGLLGALLVVRLDESVFEQLVPWLILTATVLFCGQPLAAKWVSRSPDQAVSGHSKVGLMIGQFLIAVYGGYFGAGIGILMLATLGFMGLTNIHAMNGVKTVMAVAINVVAASTFAVNRQVNWPIAAIMMAAAIVGGYFGAHYGRRMPQHVVRGIVIAVGVSMAAVEFWKR